MTLTEKIKNRYGSKRGLLRYVRYEFLRMIGMYGSLGKIDFTTVRRLVFVCHGNICRSPLAEAVARKHNIPSLSFGLDTRGNDSADPRAVSWALANGYSLELHKTTRMDEYQPAQGDLLIGMEPKHICLLRQHFLQMPVQITLGGLWLNNPIAYLHDPFNTNEDYFDHCEGIVADVAAELIKRLIN